MNRPSLSLVFPAYNEVLNLKTLVSKAFESASANSDDFEVIIVDDGSQDDSRAVLDELKGRYGERLVVYNLYPNQGYASALRTGFLNAKKELVFYSDADNQFDLGEISLLLEDYRGYDMVIGYRKDRKDNPLRLLVSWGYNRLVRMLFGLSVKDIDCAFKLFKKDIFKKIEINQKKFLIDTEILVKARHLGMKVREVGVTHLPRLKGSSTVKPKDVLFTLKGLANLKRELKRSRP